MNISPSDRLTQKRSAWRVAVGWALPVVGALLALGYFGALFILGTNPPLVPTLGKSMQPTLFQGDLAILSRITPDEVEVGDVIAFRTTEQTQTRYGVPPLVLHRVAAVNEGRQGLVFTTVGDNNNEADPYLTVEANVVGEMIASVPKAGIPLLTIAGPYGRFLLIGFAALFVIYVGLGWYERVAARTKARDELMIELTESVSALRRELGYEALAPINKKGTVPEVVDSEIPNRGTTKQLDEPTSATAKTTKRKRRKSREVEPLDWYSGGEDWPNSPPRYPWLEPEEKVAASQIHESDNPTLTTSSGWVPKSVPLPPDPVDIYIAR